MSPASSGPIDVTRCNLRVDHEGNVTVRICRLNVAFVWCKCHKGLASGVKRPRAAPGLAWREFGEGDAELESEKIGF